MSIRESLERRELQLSVYAQRSVDTKGRVRDESPCPIRTDYQRDRDRIIHSKAFRRLKHKTQVFIAPEGDHYRTRLTHTLEVAQIARTIARGLNLNEDLTEAIGLGHDLGHTPFGHGGEQVLDQLIDSGFRHYEQSLRVVDVLADDRGLNLSWEVRDGIYHHSGDLQASTLEGKIVRLADRIAYINHDIDDAIRAGVMVLSDVSKHIIDVLGKTHSERINTLVADVIVHSEGKNEICMSDAVGKAMHELREFLFEQVYSAESQTKGDQGRAQGLLARLFKQYRQEPDRLPDGWLERGRLDGPELKPGIPGNSIEPVDRACADYVASMTDRYAMMLFEHQFMPRSGTSMIPGVTCN